MKKIFRLLAVFITLCTLFGCVGCTDKFDDGKIDIVCTVFPQYDWTKEIIGESDNFNLTLLMDNGTDLHNYQATPEDIIKISSCDLFIYIGGESDAWVESTIKNPVNKKLVAINLINSLGELAKEEEHIEGMEEEHAGHDDHDDHDEHEGIEYDEHIWLSLNNAKSLTKIIADEICKLDSDNAVTYNANAAEYTAKLEQLNAQYTAFTNSATVKTLLFADRFPFRYLVDDYGLNYFAAFSGCSAETEASLETVVNLATKIDELSLKNIIVIDGSDQRLAETIKSSTTAKNQQILTLDSMQAVDEARINKGETYLNIMKSNFEVLKVALG